MVVVQFPKPLDKWCPGCETRLPTNQFNANRSKNDLLQDYCKSCNRKIRQKYRATPAGKEAIRKQDVAYRATPKGRAIARAASRKKRSDPAYVKEQNARQVKWNYARKHGASDSQMNRLWADQNYACPICGETNPTDKRGNPLQNPWVVDHDHDCCSGGRSCGHCIRGRLCGPCNQRLTFRVQSIPMLLSPRESAYLARGCVIFNADGSISRTNDIAVLEMEWFLAA